MRRITKTFAALALLAVVSLSHGAAAQSSGQDVPVPTAACLEAGSDQSVVLGRLGLQEGFGPAAFIVVMPQGVCLTGKDAADRVEAAYSVQLFSNSAEGFQDLYRLAGEKVYVRGRAQAARTFQQRAPILLEVIEIATR